MFLDAAGVAEPRRHMLERLLAAVQRRVRYVPDPVGQDPVTTWETARGDCKDSAVLFASMAVALGARVRLMAMGWKGRPSHVCAQVALDAGAPWLWAETTLDGARLGEHPTDALRRLRLEGTRDDLGG